MAVDPLASSLILLRAQIFSSSVRNLAMAGVSGMKKKQVIPKMTVMAPSTVMLVKLAPSLLFVHSFLQPSVYHRKNLRPNWELNPPQQTNLSEKEKGRELWEENVLKKIQGHRSYPLYRTDPNAPASNPPNAPLNGAAQ